MRLTRQFLFKDSVDLFGVRLAFGCFHCRTDEEAKQFVFACAVFFGLFRVSGDDFVDHGFNRARIGDLFQAFLLDHRIGRTLAIPHCIEHFFGDFARNGVVQNAFQ